MDVGETLNSQPLRRLHFPFSLSCIGEGNGNPLQCSCLENPRDGGAWWAAVYGVSQSRTRLKRLGGGSSSSRLFSMKIPCTSAPALTFLMQPLCSLLWALMEATVGLQPPPVVISNVSFSFLGDLSLSKHNESLRSVFKIGIFIWVFLILFISTLLYVWKL